MIHRIALLFLVLTQNLIAEEPVERISSVVDNVLQKAMPLKGIPYIYGGLTPKGFDCSGFLNYLFKESFPTAPTSSFGYASFGENVARDQLCSGDVVLFATGKDRKQVSHVALYLGQNSIIHAASDGPRTGVIISDLDEPYWKEHLLSFRHPPYPVYSQLPIGKVFTREYAKGWYRGSLSNGEPDGRGFFFFRNGETYVGEFSKGLFEGSGVYHWRQGAYYQGQFVAGHRDGLGIQYFGNGTSFSAVWKRDVPSSELIWRPEKKEVLASLPTIPLNSFWTKPRLANVIRTVQFPEN